MQDLQAFPNIVLLLGLQPPNTHVCGNARVRLHGCVLHSARPSSRVGSLTSYHSAFVTSVQQADMGHSKSIHTTENGIHYIKASFST